MKKWIAVRKSNGLFNALMLVQGITFMLVMLPLLRVPSDGVTYAWGQTYFGIQLVSRGVSPDYFVLFLFLALFIAAFSSFYWAKNRVFFYGMMFIWWIHVFGSLFVDLLMTGDIVFHGDTLNVHISMMNLVLGLALIAAVLIFFVIRKDQKMQNEHISWNRQNNLKALFILCPIVLQVIFFATGEPDGLTDSIAVIITIIQSIIFPLIFIPSKERRAQSITEAVPA
ncbi:ubiquinol cytochrome C oxidoreductase [Balneola sp. MJW-20]|uniref:ubiquinol cytochrome C oxidoreductase n=1 Tax=Gracilimonas aurantiaca TaxID=3234185 RepID=UPI003465996D